MGDQILTPLEPRARRPLAAAALLLLCGALFFHGLGAISLLDPDEPRYAAAAREMARGGDLLVPHLNGEPRLNKPILFYWLEAASLRLFGEGEAAARLPSALAATATVLATAAFAASRFGRRQGLFAGAVLACSPAFVVVGRLAIPDALLGFLVTIAFYAFDAARRGSRRAFLGFAVALGLAAATKGLPGVLPLSIALGIVLWRAREPFPAKGRLRAAGIAIFAILALGWPLALAWRLGARGTQEWLAGVFGRETFGRFFGGYTHLEPMTYYAPVLLGGIFPFSLLLPWAIPAALRAEERGPRAAPALLVWAATTFAFFSISSSKLSSYLHPIYPPLAILAGRWLAAPTRTLPLRLAAVATLLLAVAAPFAFHAGGKLEEARGVLVSPASFAAVGAFTLFVVEAGWFARAGLAVVANALACVSLVACLRDAAPVLFASRTEAASLGREMASLAGSEGALVFGSNLVSGVVYYADRQVIVEKDPARLLDHRPERGFLVVAIARKRLRDVPVETLAEFRERRNFRYRKKEMVLLIAPGREARGPG